MTSSDNKNSNDPTTPGAHEHPDDTAHPGDVNTTDVKAGVEETIAEQGNTRPNATSPGPATTGSLLSRLYTGTGAFDVVGRRKMWFVITAVIMVICILSMIFRGFSLSIDFEGGTQVSFPATSQTSTSAVDNAYSDALGSSPQSVQTAGSGASKTVQIRTETLDNAQLQKLTDELVNRFGPEVTRDNVSSSDVSSTWGDEITKKAIIALIVFLVIVLIYITVRFDREMAISSIAALIFDIVVTAGIYSLVGFEVSPATVIGLLTILGFSLYDTVVVFDKVGENTRAVTKTTRRTYGEQANLAVNQTFMRSINTTLISILPILALIVVAVWMLGVGMLKDLALIQLVGVISGTYSSIFFATPLLVTLKNKRAEYKRHNAKVAARRRGEDAIEDAPRPAKVAAGSAATRSAAAGTATPRITTSEPTFTARGDYAPRPQTKRSAAGNRPTGKRRK
ncbi:protein translocase subunit SecF [Gordonia jinhuaensis]|uniref:Protein-export membrane protein SecF n=1 Tax=Gordonia jinhuaensis TaxID=1517702 RepID=A0A916WZ04_9ACTN|nr:protein translocase subunit SecF [Gordonia jinhuaensis]GGB43432.1 protein translocase subunit SecF [Gordonia jinhuaensis]